MTATAMEAMLLRSTRAPSAPFPLKLLGEAEEEELLDDDEPDEEPLGVDNVDPVALPLELAGLVAEADLKKKK